MGGWEQVGLVTGGAIAVLALLVGFAYGLRALAGTWAEGTSEFAGTLPVYDLPPPTGGNAPYLGTDRPGVPPAAERESLLEPVREEIRRPPEGGRPG